MGHGTSPIFCILIYEFQLDVKLSEPCHIVHCFNLSVLKILCCKKKKEKEKNVHHIGKVYGMRVTGIIRRYVDPW